MWVAVLLLAALAACACCQAARDSIGLLVEGKVVVPNVASIPTTEIVLNGGEHRALTRADGSFSFHDVSSGIYALDIYSALYHFPQLKVKVSSENATVSVVEYKYPGATRLPTSYPIVVQAIVPMTYVIPKPPFSLMGMLMGNPMILLMLFTGIMAFAMPKLMANMSPEELEQMKRQSAQSGDPMKQLSQLMGVQQPKDDEDDN